MYSSTLSLILALDGEGWSCHAPAAVPQGRPGTHCIGGSVGPRAGLDGYRKSRPPMGLDPWIIQCVATHCTD